VGKKYTVINVSGKYQRGMRKNTRQKDFIVLAVI